MRTKIDPTILLSLVGKTVYYNGVPVDKNTLQQWKEEIHLYRKMSFFHSLQETLRHRFISQGIHTSTQWEHVIASKAQLNLLDLTEEWLTIIEKA